MYIASHYKEVRSILGTRMNNEEYDGALQILGYVIATFTFPLVTAEELFRRGAFKPDNDLYVGLGTAVWGGMSSSFTLPFALATACYHYVYDVKAFYLLGGEVPVVAVRSSMKGSMLDFITIVDDCVKSQECGADIELPARVLAVVAGIVGLIERVRATQIKLFDEAAGMLVDTAYNAATGSEVFKGLSLSEIVVLGLQGSSEAGAQDL